MINIGKYSLNKNFEIFKDKVRDTEGVVDQMEAPFKAIPLEYQNKDFDLQKFENHQKNIDIHLILEGSEKIGINSVDNLESNMTYNSESDYQLFNGEVKEEIVLEKGDFLILFPGEAHVTGGKYNNLTTKKMVYKVPL